MRTTTRSSDRVPRFPSRASRLWRAIALCGLAMSVGCITPTDPATMFELTADSPAHKAMQTRRFETSKPGELLSASAAVLQDLGFQVSESTLDVGFLRSFAARGSTVRRSSGCWSRA